MTDELRVTVVATGLGGVPAVSLKPIEATAPQIEIVKKPVEVDYDEPTVMRNRQGEQKKQVANSDVNMDYLDIPAFLRRQAD